MSALVPPALTPGAAVAHRRGPTPTSGTAFAEQLTALTEPAAAETCGLVPAVPGAAARAEGAGGGLAASPPDAMGESGPVTAGPGDDAALPEVPGAPGREQAIPPGTTTAAPDVATPSDGATPSDATAPSDAATPSDATAPPDAAAATQPDVPAAGGSVTHRDVDESPGGGVPRPAAPGPTAQLPGGRPVPAAGVSVAGTTVAGSPLPTAHQPHGATDTPTAPAGSGADLAPAAVAVSPTPTAPAAAQAPEPAGPTVPQPQPPPPPPLRTQLAGPALQLLRAGEGQHVITVSVTPENLGPVTIRAHVSGEQMHVELYAPSDAARDALRALAADLRRDLAGLVGQASLVVSRSDTPPPAAGGGDGSLAGRHDPGAGHADPDAAQTDLGAGHPRPQGARPDTYPRHAPDLPAGDDHPRGGRARLDVLA